jgi:adenylosuccinate synthase
MRTARVVIGAGYGDEGKGLISDAFVASEGADATVVRFNGGAQAGHTVTLDGGRRHVFHHVGSGAFAGAATYLSRFFVANPILLAEELGELAALDVHPRIAIDPAAPVTTPYDMMINQITEQARGKGRHGSCGLGFGETVERSMHPQFALTADMLTKPDAVLATLHWIRSAWLPVRLAALRIHSLSQADRELIGSDAILERWLDDVAAFLGAVAIGGAAAMLRQVPSLLFEGAQGLMLDQHRGAFPHVTRSNTGLRNVLALAPELDIDRLDVTYVTRAYATRHGAGPLAHELPQAPHHRSAEETNIANPWQGEFRYGVLDLSILQRAIADDLSEAADAQIMTSHNLAMTCLDQIRAGTNVIASGRKVEAAPEVLANMAAHAVDAASLSMSFEPTRSSVRQENVQRLSRSRQQSLSACGSSIRQPGTCCSDAHK